MSVKVVSECAKCMAWVGEAKCTFTLRHEIHHVPLGQSLSLSLAFRVGWYEGKKEGGKNCVCCLELRGRRGGYKCNKDGNRNTRSTLPCSCYEKTVKGNLLPTILQ